MRFHADGDTVHSARGNGTFQYLISPSSIKADRRTEIAFPTHVLLVKMWPSLYAGSIALLCTVLLATAVKDAGAAKAGVQSLQKRLNMHLPENHSVAWLNDQNVVKFEAHPTKGFTTMFGKGYNLRATEVTSKIASSTSRGTNLTCSKSDDAQRHGLRQVIKDLKTNEFKRWSSATDSWVPVDGRVEYERPVTRSMTGKLRSAGETSQVRADQRPTESRESGASN
ncbi:hypothetical protein CBOM_06072 [Ceraceosorus bombacis]|uniref:Uncharacterized protein n=1 Tax=Ceraceosorus bombacis TaxID=401625 RepID=A0A0P1BKD0_9BASI|nr:hypothetical protein CBOM_06072 [Ceraceosorus bombacis]